VLCTDKTARARQAKCLVISQKQNPHFRGTNATTTSYVSLAGSDSCQPSASVCLLSQQYFEVGSVSGWLKEDKNVNPAQ
jgi:hypothetical protein